MERHIFKKGMSVFMAVTRQKYSKADQEIFYALMKDLDGRAFLSAIAGICKNKKEIFPGTNIVSLIREKAEKISDPRISGAQAWEMVIDASGSIAKQNALNPTIIRTFKSLGFEWHTLIPGGGFALPADKIGFMRRDFLNFYEQFSELSENKKIGQTGWIESTENCKH